MSLLQLCEWLEGTALGILVRESLWGFQTTVAVHILGLALSAGVIVWFDLRLLGVSMTRCPVSQVYRRLIPFASAGFALMFASGLALLVAYATSAYGNAFFRTKMIALVLAGLNAAFYHRVTERRIADWDRAARLPPSARLAGLTSIVLWALVIFSGRMMSYTMF
jgi:hypothetical protein